MKNVRDFVYPVFNVQIKSIDDVLILKKFFFGGHREQHLVETHFSQGRFFQGCKFVD